MKETKQKQNLYVNEMPLPTATLSMRKSSGDFVTEEQSISTSAPTLAEAVNALAWLKDLAEGKVIKVNTEAGSSEK